MGFKDLAKNFNNAEGIRESMRMSFDKHRRKAQSGQISGPDTSPAQCGLYGALSTRYRADGLNPPEATVWAELAPFLGLPDVDSRESLAEYIVFREKPGEARVDDLRKKVNEGLNIAERDVLVMAAMAVEQGVAWGQFLDEHTRSVLNSCFSEDA